MAIIIYRSRKRSSPGVRSSLFCNSPVYALLGGGKFRDKIRLYADTTESDDPKIYAQ